MLRKSVIIDNVRKNVEAIRHVYSRSRAVQKLSKNGLLV